MTNNEKLMSPKTYHLATGIFFVVIGILCLLRALMGWSVIANEAMIPMWVSWVGVVVFGYLAYHAFSTKKHK